MPQTLRSRKRTPRPKRRNPKPIPHRHSIHHRRLACEALEDRRMLSVGGYPDLPGLQLSEAVDDAAVPVETVEQAMDLFGLSPALFVENQGQWEDTSVRYAFFGNGANVLHTDTGPVFQLFQSAVGGVSDGDVDFVGGVSDGDPGFVGGDSVADPFDDPYQSPITSSSLDPISSSQTQSPSETPPTSVVFSMRFEGAETIEPVGWDRAETYFNYYVGDQEYWRSGVPAFETVAYPGLYDGIDLLTWGRRDSLKYEFRVAPGADYRQIEVSYEGIDGLWLDDDGALHVETPLGELIDDAPYIYQEIDGQQVEVPGRFELTGADSYSFAVTGPFDPSVELVVDPSLAWSTYLGGDRGESGRGIAVDTAGNVLVTGYTGSAGWVSRGFDTSYGGNLDAFVAKLSPSGSHLWSTYLGGDDSDYGYDIAVDTAGNVLVTGWTRSAGWVSGGFDTSFDGRDAFVAKLSPSGAHLWSTYLGGEGPDRGYGIAVDTAGNVLVTGSTFLGGFLGTNAFVAKLSPSGSQLWSTYFGGEWGSDSGFGIAADTAGNVLVTGTTRSGGWVSGGFDTSHNGGVSDAFVVKLSPSGSHLWSTYLGGSDSDGGYGIAVDTAGNVLVTGSTRSPGWVSGGFDTSYNRGEADAFVAKLSPSGGHLWSTYLGGARTDVGGGIAVDRAGNVLVTGITQTVGWFSEGFDTSLDIVGGGFVAKLRPSGSPLWSAYLGGYGIAVDTAGNVLVTGTTASAGWASGGFDTSLDGREDAFVAKISGAASGDPALLSGVTVITHGWQPGFRPIGIGGFPDWAITMGQAILDLADGVDEVGKRIGSIFKNNPDTGQWESLGDDVWENSNSVFDEIVLLYDWAWESNDPEDGWLEAAADNLFASLLDAPDALGVVDLIHRPLHFIGHSRGAVLNSLVTERIGYYFPEVMIDQVTSLDPHPWSFVDDPGYNPDDGDESRLYQYGNVAFADNYYRQDLFYEFDLDFNGVEADRAKNYRLDNDFLNGRGGLDHSDVHTWYYGTITESLPDDYDGLGEAARNHDGGEEFDETWFDPNRQMGPRNATGYAFSRIGGGENRLDADNDRTAPLRQPGSVFNGDFEYGLSRLLGFEIPGWERHGGLSDGHWTNDGRLHLGEVGLWNYTLVRHNPLYFPRSVTSLTFTYDVTDTSSDDVLEVLIGDTVIWTYMLTEEGQHTATIDRSFLPLGRVDTLAFRLNYGDGLFDVIGSDVYLDNIAFVLGPIAFAGGQYDDADEGEFVVLSAVGSQRGTAAITQYAWDLDGDGQFDDAQGQTVVHAPADNGGYLYSVRVTDANGALDVDTAVLTVHNVAPSVDAGAEQTIDEGATFSGAGFFIDPGADTWTATVDYGDGSGVQPLVLSGKGFNLSHRYTDDGVYTVTVTVDDDDQGSGRDTTTVTVVATPPEITVLGNGMSIADGDTTPGTSDHTSFGSVVQGEPGPTRTFAVRNDGSLTLTLGGVSVPPGYTLVEALSSSLGEGESDTFTVRLDTTTVGTKDGEISFANNDSSEDPFNFSITGEITAITADLTGNGFVDFEDLTVLLAAWNQNVSAARGNLVDAAGTPVNFEDLTVLLAAWTGPGAAGAAQAAVVRSDWLGPVDQDRMNPVTTSTSTSTSTRRAAGDDDVVMLKHNLRAARRAALRFGPAGGSYGRLQAAAVDRAMGEEGLEAMLVRHSLRGRRRDRP